MTKADTDAITELRKELASYHCEVREHIARFEACDGAVQVLQADMYGVPGNKDDSPGVMGEVANLKASKSVMLNGLRAVWSVVILAISVVTVIIFGD